MTAEQLHNSILQEAISGRLVPQDPNDEPAAVLLQRIREEKARLVKEKKLKKKDLVDTPITEEEIPFEIPASWEWVRLGYLVDFSKSSSVKASSISPNAWILDLEDIQKNTGVLLRKKRMGETVSISDKHQFKKGNVLYSKLRPYLNKVIVADEDGYCTSEILCFNFGEINNRYAQLFLMSAFFVDYAMKDAYGVKMPRLGSKQGNNALFPLPPLAEQKRIVAKLEELLPIVEQYGKAQKELDELNAALPARLRQSILQEAISGRLVPQDPNDEPAAVLLQRIREERECLFKAGKIKKKDYHIYDISDEEIPFELPQGWAWEKLGNLTEIISDGTHKTPHYVESGIPFLSVQNISGGQLDLSKIKYITQAEHEELIKRVKPQKGDLLICRIGTLGKAIKIYWDFEFSIFVSLGLIRLVDSSLANYISLIINSPIGNSWIQENKVGGGTHTFKINLGDIPNMMLPLPPLAEQQRIVAKIEELFEQIDKIRK